jgi:predicted Zn-dependent peptidase
VSLGVAVAQAALGYIVAVPGPGDARFDAFRLLLYILSHDYEGRLGVAAISQRGLAYYIDSRYRSDGVNGWITLAVGVDPHKMDALKALLETELQRLVDAPPTMAEVQEAKTHFLGRATSAAQSNAELANALAEHWLWFDTVPTRDQLEQRLNAVSHADVQQAAADFASGMTIIVAE